MRTLDMQSTLTEPVRSPAGDVATPDGSLDPAASTETVVSSRFVPGTFPVHALAHVVSNRVSLTCVAVEVTGFERIGKEAAMEIAAEVRTMPVRSPAARPTRSLTRIASAGACE